MSSPDLRLLLAYRLLGWRLGPDHQDWVYRDITGKWYLVRQGLPLLLGLGAVLAVLFWTTGASPSRVLPALVAVFAVLVLLRRTVVERALRQQGLDPDGQVDPSAQSWYDDPEQRRRRSVAGAVLTVLLVVAGLLLIGTGPR